MTNSEDARIIAGMKLQDEARLETLAGGAGRLGWKAGFGTAAAMGAISVTAPLVGYLTTATVLPDGAEVDVSGWSTALLEPEVALRIDRELRPGATEDEILAGIGAFGAAIELADLEPTTDVEKILAGDIFHRHVLLAGEMSETAAGLDEATVTIDIDGQTHIAGADPKEAIGDFAGLLASLLPQLELIGESLLPGDIVITGSAVPPILIEGGQEVSVSLSTGSRIGVGIA